MIQALDLSQIFSAHRDVRLHVASVRLSSRIPHLGTEPVHLAYVWSGILSMLPNVRHLSFGRPASPHLIHILIQLSLQGCPLVGLHDLPIDSITFPALALFLESTRHTIQHLSLVQEPGSRIVFDCPPLHMPELLSLSLDIDQDPLLLASTWLERMMDESWQREDLERFSIGLNSVGLRGELKDHWDDPADTRVCGFPGLGAFIAAWRRRWEEEDMVEAAFAWPGTGLLGVNFEEANLRPFLSLTRIIIVQREAFSSAIYHHELLAALVSTVSIGLLPDLDSIIWVLPKGVSRERSLWPG